MQSFKQFFESDQITYEEGNGWYYINLFEKNNLIGRLTWTISGANEDYSYPTELELHYIFISKKWRNTGAGEKLLKLFKHKAKEIFPTSEGFVSYITWIGIYGLLNKVFGPPFLVVDDEKDEELYPDEIKLRKTQPKASLEKISYQRDIRAHYPL